MTNEQDSGLPEAVRAAIERTLASSAGSAAQGRDRAAALLDEVARRGTGARQAVARRGERARDATNELTNRVVDAIVDLRLATREDLGAVEERLDALEARLSRLEGLEVRVQGLESVRSRPESTST